MYVHWLLILFFCSSLYMYMYIGSFTLAIYLLFNMHDFFFLCFRFFLHCSINIKETRFCVNGFVLCLLCKWDNIQVVIVVILLNLSNIWTLEKCTIFTLLIHDNKLPQYTISSYLCTQKKTKEKKTFTSGYYTFLLSLWRIKIQVHSFFLPFTLTECPTTH